MPWSRTKWAWPCYRAIIVGNTVTRGTKTAKIFSQSHGRKSASRKSMSWMKIFRRKSIITWAISWELFPSKYRVITRTRRSSRWIKLYLKIKKLAWDEDSLCNTQHHHHHHLKPVFLTFKSTFNQLPGPLVHGVTLLAVQNRNGARNY